MTDELPLPWADIRLWEIGMLQQSTGSGLEHWLARIGELAPPDVPALRDWLTIEGVSGYPRALLVHETFGYPDSTVRAADELIDAQYADRPTLRPILDAVLLYAGDLEDVSIQTRTTHVALTGPIRTFAVVQPSTTHRVDLGLRIEMPPDAPNTRLRPASHLGADFPARIALTSTGEVDSEVAAWLKYAYDSTN
ncbi:DUF5655 domain-containing protein [Cryobacterium sp.]|jgi:hypothetical protein|uniref:DUF5655 domain-containing protein n=1 Tax=Cryobacterium sp. TaxID=1926290 RepID=UPI0026043A79|nr:DUF5655 domain-containing protein [Cryobacterium sp.]MCU1444635.1 hypothetical protein [Cryobacterium sp.]